MIQQFLKLFLFMSVSFAAMEGAGAEPRIGDLYTQVLKPNYEKIAPLREYAKKRQTTYIVSAILAVIVFGMFVKYFQAFGALVAIVMIAGGVWYLKMQTPAISPYKAKFSELILSPIAENCCGYRYHPGKITESDINASRLFSPRIKTFSAHEGLFVKEGVKFGYVEIEFDTKENASVERFAKNVFSGFVVILDRQNPRTGALVSEAFKARVADIDPEFGAFFADLTRAGKRGGFEIFGEVADTALDRCSGYASQEIAVSFTPHKTYLYFYQKSDPLDPSPVQDFSLQQAKSYAAVFESIDAMVNACR